MTQSWPSRHFSQNNPAGPAQADVPALLRTLAESIEALGQIEVLDIVFSQHVTADGPWPSFTVYFHDERGQP